MDELPAAAADAVEARLASRIAAASPAHDGEAEGALYRLLAPRIRRYGQRHLRDDHAAADLVQHVMALTLEQLRGGRLREPERIVSFVFGTCRMTVKGMRRGARRREELLERHAEMVTIADVAVAPRLDHLRVADCLERLPERERSLLVLTFYEDKAAEQVASELGLTPGNVRVVRHRAIAKMRQCVDGGWRLSS